jgi:glycosyltransferase involved in cell wall biosynthesis
VTVSDALADELRARRPEARVVTIPSGSDFDDFDGLVYRRGTEFRVTHAGSFFGQRDPRPFLRALERVEGVNARFVGDSRAADREWSRARCLADRVEWIPATSRARALALQRDSEALLLLIPDAGGRGRGILSGKVFEYLASGRPIIALVPPDGAAAELVRASGAGMVVAPDDVDGAQRALTALRDSWVAGDDLSVELPEEVRRKISRSTGVAALADLLGAVVER